MRTRLFTEEFKKKAVFLSVSRGSVKEIAEELGIRAELLCKWRNNSLYKGSRLLADDLKWRGGPLKIRRLEMEELQPLRNKSFTIARLAEARDCFMFMCYTGFAYTDVRELSGSNLFKEMRLEGILFIASKERRFYSFKLPINPSFCNCIVFDC